MSCAAARSSSTAYFEIPYGSSGCGTIASVIGTWPAP